jgi:hypothetical protein
LKDIPSSRYLSKAVSEELYSYQKCVLRMKFIHEGSIFLIGVVGSNGGFVICIE